MWTARGGREETGADGDGPLPGLIAGQVCGIRRTVLDAVGRRMLAGHKPAEVSRDVLVLLGDIEDLLDEKVLNCAVRGPS
ncbi:hypothetical protein ABZ299_13330 [Streptomyces sp. NPDC006184]|uniref:hypothetical protein n=1 Tax=Streptomyces sp. NPDC006184 TaxID=3155455 RepID=UPI0033BC827A